jgi:hypothetical protein
MGDGSTADAAQDRLWAAATTASGRSIGLDLDQARAEATSAAKQTDAYKQLRQCFPGWTGMATVLRTPTLKRLAENTPIDPNNPDNWMSQAHAVQGVLRRHGIDGVRPDRLTFSACERLLAGQVEADRAAGLDWTKVVAPASRMAEALRDATAQLPISLDDAGVWSFEEDKRRIVADRLGLSQHQSDDISNWTIRRGGDVDLDDLRAWQIGSDTWLQMAEDRLGPVGVVDRPVGVMIVPDRRGKAWQLRPCLSLDFVRLVAMLDGRVGPELTSAWIPPERAADLVDGMNHLVLHAGPKQLMGTSHMTQQVSDALKLPMAGGRLTDKRDRWGRVAVKRTSGEIRLAVMTFSVPGFKSKRLGSISRLNGIEGGARMDLGEAINTAVELGLPVVLSSEAAGHLDGQIRVGRMKGKPGMLTVTRAEGMSAVTRRVVAEQALPELRRLKGGETPVTIDAGARQVVRMMAVRPLLDDPILLGRQKEVAAVMVVGSGLNASQVGTGKSVMTGRAFYHRAATTKAFRGVLVAEGRLLPQWFGELVNGAPARGMPPLTPNCTVRVLDERRSVAGQLRRWDREVGDGPLIVLASNSILDRFGGELAVMRFHLGVADEALRYANPTTDAHRALRAVRMSSWADCWLLTATPRGKNREALDVLVGLAVGDEEMIADRLNTREAGDLMDEINAHRLRINYGPHLLRVTGKDMENWMPKVRPATPMAVEADGALQELLDAIRKGGRDAYLSLLRLLEEVRAIDKGRNPDLHKAALARLSRAQAVVLSNVNVYVDASVDPTTLKHSSSALAQALVRKGTVDKAMRGGGNGLPLLRSIVATSLAEVAGEEQVIVFAERVWCLRNLASTLRDHFGVEAHYADGSLSEEEFEDLKRRFVANEFPVLCLSKVGQQGHNLQNASVIYHYDLPYTQPPLEQRAGRVGRLGSSSSFVETVIPYIKGAGMEHVVSILTPRGAEHHQVLDSFEGVAASDSTVANHLGQITADVAQSKLEAGYAGTAARLQVAAAVFGF